MSYGNEIGAPCQRNYFILTGLSKFTQNSKCLHDSQEAFTNFYF